jgi:hypothetical protein
MSIRVARPFSFEPLDVDLSQLATQSLIEKLLDINPENEKVHQY